MKGLYAAIGILALPLVLNSCSGSKEDNTKDYTYRLTRSVRPIAAVANGNYVSVLYDPENHDRSVVRSFEYRNPEEASKACALLQGEITYGDSAEISITVGHTTGGKLEIIDITAKHFPYPYGLEPQPTPEKDW